MSEHEQIIERISEQTKILLQNHWPDISDFRDSEESIKIGFSTLIQYQGQERIVETKISFGKRVTDSMIDRIDTDQMHLDLTPLPAKRGPGRPKKNILEMAISTAPLAGPAA